MHFLQETIKKSNAYVWCLGSLFSLVLLFFVIYLIDIEKLKVILVSISWIIFVIAVFVLLLEGFFTALRFKVFTPGNPPLKDCLEMTAWFIMSLIILPARLGEIAVIILLKNNLSQSTGAAIMNVLTQRFIDLLFLCAMLIVFMFYNLPFYHDLYLYTIIFLIISLLFLSLYKLDVILGFIASLFYLNKSRPKKKLLKIFFRMSLQARVWYRFHLNKRIFSVAIIISIFKWMSNIGGITLLFYSINIPLTEIQLLLASSAYNFLAIIPLQTIGGIGISEAGLTSIFIFFGLPVAFSASASILIRIVLISTPFLFLLSVRAYYFALKK